jgi:hypothetical protein
MEEKLQLFGRPIRFNQIHRIWIEEYKRNRYMKALTIDALKKRFAYIMSNLMILSDDGKYRPVFNMRADGIYAPIRGLDYLRMAIEIYAEQNLRALKGDDLKVDEAEFHRARRLSDESWCKRLDWVEGSRLSLDKYEQPRMLFRFAEAQWNREFLTKGRLRIAPASSYNDFALDRARRDDEIVLEWHDDKGTIWDVFVDDYYCVCFSSSYDYRLYMDFLEDSDRRSCVAIRDRAALFERLKTAIGLHNAAHPDEGIGAVRASPVIYVDPLKMLKPEIPDEVRFCKNFRFAYQTEYRFVLQPAAGRHHLKPFFLELGSIEDIAELIEDPNGK